MARKVVNNLSISEETNNVVEFKKPKLQLITGGGDAGDNWLEDMPKGAIFLARDKRSVALKAGHQPPIVLEMYMVANKAVKSTELYLKAPDGASIDIWVPTNEFSQKKDLWELLAETSQSEETNGNSEGSVQPE